MTEAMKKSVHTIRGQLHRIRPAVAGLEGSEAVPHPQYVVTNTELMLCAIEHFYGNTNMAAYFPALVTENVASRMADSASALSAIPSAPENTPADIPPGEILLALRKLDEAYAYCLEFGLLTFGFDGKKIQEQVNLIQGYTLKAETASQNATAALHGEQEKFAAAIKAALASVDEKSQEAIEFIGVQSKAVAPIVEGAKSHADEAAAAASTAKDRLGDAQKSAEAAAQLQQEIANTSTNAGAASQKLAADATAVLTSIQAAEKQALDASANARANSQAATEARASVGTKLDDITKFFGDIEKHQEEMLSARKDATSTLSMVKEETEKRLNEYSQRTETIVTRNEEQQKEISDHLVKAVGVSLFKAFEKRRGHIFWGTIGWAALLLVAALGALAFAIWFVTELRVADITASVILSRLIIAVPITFVVVFASRQYSRERRAEEEYAFKAAISVSLEPYRELIERMRKEGSSADTEFMRTLILEVFDNPTKRLYSEVTSPGEQLDAAPGAARSGAKG